MKIRFFIYGTVLAIGLGLFFLVTYPARSYKIIQGIAPNYACNLRSGETSAIGFDQNSTCPVGCSIVDIVHIQPPNCFDCDTYTYRCIAE